MEAIDREKFGAFVAARRKELGLTQQELAGKLFLSNKAVSKWETGQSLPDIGLLEPLAQCLGVSVAELLRGERIEERPIEVAETEELLGRAIQFADGGSQDGKTRRRWKIAWAASMALQALSNIIIIFVLIPHGTYTRLKYFSVLGVMELLYMIFSLWAVFSAPARLPRYYDENRITSFSQGPVRLNLGGIPLHNGNWPHILAALRWSLVASQPALPWLYVLGQIAFLQHGTASVVFTVIVLMGLFVPVMVVAKKYE